MGYRDTSTLRAALKGASNIDPSRLGRLAVWSATEGKPLDLHWLLTGTGSPWRSKPQSKTLWLTQERADAIRVLAEGLGAGESTASSRAGSSRPKSHRGGVTPSKGRRRR